MARNPDTVIPFLQRGAVVVGAWMTNSQFLDGIALSGILPAPLIIFATFVGLFRRRAVGRAGHDIRHLSAGVRVYPARSRLP